MVLISSLLIHHLGNLVAHFSVFIRGSEANPSDWCESWSMWQACTAAYGMWQHRYLKPGPGWQESFSDVQPYRRRSLQAVLVMCRFLHDISCLRLEQWPLQVKCSFWRCLLVTNVTRLTALTCGSGHLTVPPSKNWSWFFVVQMPFMFSLAGWSSLSQQPLHHGWLFHGNFGISQNFSATSWSTLRKSIMHQANSLRFSTPTKATCEPA